MLKVGVEGPEDALARLAAGDASDALETFVEREAVSYRVLKRKQIFKSQS